jgi:hypothetical protein
MAADSTTHVCKPNSREPPAFNSGLSAPNARCRALLSSSSPRRGGPASSSQGSVNDFAIEQIRDRGEVDVRMWTDINTLADAEFGRPHLVEEDKGADHLPHPGRQRTANLEAAKIAGAGRNHRFN